MYLILYWDMQPIMYFDVSISMIANVSSPSSSMLLPPHIENVAQVMVATLTPVAYQRADNWFGVHMYMTR